jgi:hypothetical protein
MKLKKCPKNHESDERNASFQGYEGGVANKKLGNSQSSTSSWREHKS